MSKIQDGLQQALVAERKKRQDLEQVNNFLANKVNWLEVVKKDFPEPNPTVQGLADNAYWINGKTPNALTAIAYNNYPDNSFDTLIETVKGIDPLLAGAMNEDFNFTVLGEGDSYCASGFKNTGGIAVDTEGWGDDLPSELKDWDEDEEKAGQIRDAISQFESDLIDEIQTYLEKEGIEDELDRYFLKSDLLKVAVLIKKVDEDGLILTNYGLLGWRCDDESEWEFINRHRGSLIGISQIVNPELLPDFLQSETIFVIE